MMKGRKEVGKRGGGTGQKGEREGREYKGKQ